MPFPSRFTTFVLPVVELLENTSVPDAAPAATGSNCTSIVMAIDGFNVTGNIAPEKVNPAPVRFAADTVTGAVPVDVSFKANVMDVPTGSLPKFRVVALRVITGLAGCVPVPLSATVWVVPLEELLAMVMLPLAAPATLGSKLT